jgi:NADH:ubiquinone oxidoreductase subunit 3 (subunit A)
MPSGWDVYYIVFLSAFLALGIPAALAFISYLVSPKVNHRKFARRAGDPVINTVLADATERNRTELGQKINARFFLAANASLVLIALMLVLVPCVGMLQPGTDHEGLLRGLTAIVSIAAFAALGLLYSARKSDLGWLESYQQAKKTPNESRAEGDLS